MGAAADGEGLLGVARAVENEGVRGGVGGGGPTLQSGVDAAMVDGRWLLSRVGGALRTAAEELTEAQVLPYLRGDASL